jgi:hypothetical protein
MLVVVVDFYTWCGQKFGFRHDDGMGLGLPLKNPSISQIRHQILDRPRDQILDQPENWHDNFG